MTHDNAHHARTDTQLPRREFLVVAGGTLAVGLAGCSGVTEQSFEAAPVALPDTGQEELLLAETSRESETITREGPSGNVEVEITNHASVYRRGPAVGGE